MPRAWRVNSGTPKASSSCCSSLVAAGWLIAMAPRRAAQVSVLVEQRQQHPLAGAQAQQQARWQEIGRGQSHIQTYMDYSEQSI